MAIYRIACTIKDCDYDDEWLCSYDKYKKRLKKGCEKCGGKLEQHHDTMNFILKGTGWTRSGMGVGSAKYKAGSQEALDDALRENDYLTEKSEKDPDWLEARDRADEEKSNAEAKATQYANGVNVGIPDEKD